MAFFVIYWQSSPSWRHGWRLRSPERTTQLADFFELLLKALDSPEYTPERLSRLFFPPRDQFRDRLSSSNPQRFPHRGQVLTSVCAILELLFGPTHGPSIERHLFTLPVEQCHRFLTRFPSSRFRLPPNVTVVKRTHDSSHQRFCWPVSLDRWPYPQIHFSVVPIMELKPNILQWRILPGYGSKSTIQHHVPITHRVNPTIGSASHLRPPFRHLSWGKQFHRSHARSV